MRLPDFSGGPTVSTSPSPSGSLLVTLSDFFIWSLLELVTEGISWTQATSTSSAEQEATGIVFQSCLSSTQLDVQRSQQRAGQRERRQWTDSESAVERSLYGRSMALQLRASSASPALRD